MCKDTEKTRIRQSATTVSWQIEEKLPVYFRDLLKWLDQTIARRLVVTL